MLNLTLNDFILFLEDLLSKRVEWLRLSAIGVAFEPAFRKRLEALKALPATLRSKPLAELLGETDQLHDAYGSALDYLTRGLEELPFLTKEQRALATEIRTNFVPSRSLLIASYPDETAHAGKVKPTLTTMEAGLRSFKIVGDHTLYDVAAGFVTNGEKLGELLSDRADAIGDADRSEVKGLRGKTLRLINRFRGMLEEEIDENPDLPRDLDTKVFGFLDQLAGDRSRAAAGATAARRAAPPEGGA
jgi:hypothetical protein